MSNIFKITLLLSFSWHLIFLSVFEPVITTRFRPAGPENTAFLGSILRVGELLKPRLFAKSGTRALNIKTVYPPRDEGFLSPSVEDAVKPAAGFIGPAEKSTFIEPKDLEFAYKPKEKPALTFYPVLPYSFILYFTDRQVAHMEFIYYVSDDGKITYVKRKVSSGNLETDLLAYRYITHCLFLQEGRFPANTWQSVKIDLTRRDND
ncbi:MAG: hypothetical protein PHJ00_01605 [Candidatus Omnitrophica bacterium]|nr:hypothetical protein [Candidatus Omnitrophota bacterium]MDD5654620.1 hypothetical protein [Candidatus Omnitrophota bacterium]